MPYIPKKNRPVLDWIAKNLAAELCDKPLSGSLNYFIYKVFIELKRHGKVNNYENMSRFLAELHESAEEIRRRQLAEYEDYCINKNGDVE